jgi:hypothetical protein
VLERTLVDPKIDRDFASPIITIIGDTRFKKQAKMVAKSTTTRALIPTASNTELAFSTVDFLPLITEWHAALGRRVAAGELAPATHSAYTIGAADHLVERFGDGQIRFGTMQ